MQCGRQEMLLNKHYFLCFHSEVNSEFIMVIMNCYIFITGQWCKHDKSLSERSFRKKSYMFVGRQSVSFILPVSFMCSCFLIGGFDWHGLQVPISKAASLLLTWLWSAKNTISGLHAKYLEPTTCVYVWFSVSRKTSALAVYCTNHWHKNKYAILVWRWCFL